MFILYGMCTNSANFALRTSHLCVCSSQFFFFFSISHDSSAVIQPFIHLYNSTTVHGRISERAEEKKNSLWIHQTYLWMMMIIIFIIQEYFPMKWYLYVLLNWRCQWFKNIGIFVEFFHSKRLDFDQPNS